MLWGGAVSAGVCKDDSPTLLALCQEPPLDSFLHSLETCTCRHPTGKDSRMRDLEDRIDQLARRLCPHGAPARTQEHLVITLESGFEFYCHEDWGLRWTVTLPQHKHHWKAADGTWVEGTTDKPIMFMAKDLERCLATASDYVDAWSSGALVTRDEYLKRVKDGHYARMAGI